MREKQNKPRRSGERSGDVDQIRSSEFRQRPQISSTSSSGRSLSENKLHRELDNPIVARIQSAVAADIAGDLREVWSCQCSRTTNTSRTSGAWSSEINVIGKVECLRTHLNRRLFPNREGP